MWSSPKNNSDFANMNQELTANVLLEVCVGSVTDARAAEAGGAGRIELCGALELGGLTPSLGLIEQAVAAVDLPVMAMIRPRAGGFCYSEAEFHCMMRDAELAMKAGAQGMVFGVLNENSCVDAARTKQLVDAAGSGESVFHRAFDFVSNPLESLDTLIELGINRVLTTGGAATAAEGIESLSHLAKHAAGRIQIMPGGNVSVENIAKLVAAINCKQVHTGSVVSSVDLSLTREATASLCDLPRLKNGEFRTVDKTRVSKLKAALCNEFQSRESDF